MSLKEVFVARQPVFDKKENIWGYELLFRTGSKLNEAGKIDDEVATSQVILDGFNLAFESNSNYKYLINFSETSLKEELFKLLPAEHLVVEVLERVNPTAEVFEVCEGIKKQGYLLALDDYIGQEGFEDLVSLADIVKVDVLELYDWELEDLVGKLRKHKNIKLLAEKVEDREKFLFCQQLGFDYFQGFFFSKPQILEGKKLSASELSKLRILKEISKKEVDFKSLSEIIKQDVNLTYRLLKYINSPYFGFIQKTSSIERGLTCLEEQKIKQWLRVIVLADFTAGDAGRELLFLSAFRAKFLQLLASKIFDEEAGEKFFLIGLLSCLDVLLHKPLPEILKELALAEEIVAGLLQKEHPYHKWLLLALALEKGNWQEAALRLKELKIEPELSATCLHEAYEWIKNLLQSSA